MSTLTDPFLTHFRYIEDSPDYDEILKIHRACIHFERLPKTHENYQRIQDLYKMIYTMIGIYEDKNVNGKRGRE
jgi:hypothetical protein